MYQPNYGSASHPAILIVKDGRKADAVLAPHQNIENNPMQSNMVAPAWSLDQNILTCRANQRRMCGAPSRNPSPLMLGSADHAPLSHLIGEQAPHDLGIAFDRQQQRAGWRLATSACIAKPRTLQLAACTDEASSARAETSGADSLSNPPWRRPQPLPKAFSAPRL
jgi:hypothetical protein